MSATVNLLTTLEKMLRMHNDLFKSALKKTDYLKVGDMESLNQILKEEQGLVAQINKLENVRKQIVKNILPNTENPTVKDCIKAISGNEKEQLIKVTDSLTAIVLELKERNYLNQQLIYQSLQYVNFSLNLLNPQTESINYGPPARNKVGDSNIKGIFNSEA
ncbi:flagellar protein FlgN [Robertmurraya sp. Marseille-Q9965]